MSLVTGIILNFRVIKVIFKRYRGLISAHKSVKSVKIWNEIKPLLVKKILILFLRREILFESKHLPLLIKGFREMENRLNVKVKFFIKYFLPEKHG